jgi:hypothetical protein
MMRMYRVTLRMLPCVLVVAIFGATAGSAQAATVPDSPQATATSQTATPVLVTAEGVQAFVVAKDASAPREYAFPVTLPPGGRLVSSAGEIIALDSAGDVMGIFHTASARDARGATVPTHYRIEGSSIVQKVEFTESTAFPTVIDIDFLKIARCGAAIVFVALTTVFVAGKAIKIVKAVQAARKWVASVGGAREAARLVVGASTEAERAKVLASARSIAGASVLDFFGISQIRSGCF